jgi:hypothetical protein
VSRGVNKRLTNAPCRAADRCGPESRLGDDRPFLRANRCSRRHHPDWRRVPHFVIRQQQAPPPLREVQILEKSYLGIRGRSPHCTYRSGMPRRDKCRFCALPKTISWAPGTRGKRDDSLWYAADATEIQIERLPSSRNIWHAIWSASVIFGGGQKWPTDGCACPQI